MMCRYCWNASRPRLAAQLASFTLSPFSIGEKKRSIRQNNAFAPGVPRPSLLPTLELQPSPSQLINTFAWRAAGRWNTFAPAQGIQSGRHCCQDLEIMRGGVGSGLAVLPNPPPSRDSSVFSEVKTKTEFCGCVTLLSGLAGLAG